MPPRGRRLLTVVILIAAGILLLLIFPRALAFAELAAREVRYLWWIILLVLLGGWLIWGSRAKTSE